MKVTITEPRRKDYETDEEYMEAIESFFGMMDSYSEDLKQYDYKSNGYESDTEV